jgi:pyridoxal biosynthesis lyase PdxS
VTTDPILLEAMRGWIHVCGERAVLNALADVCEQAADISRRKEPGTTNASINSGYIREAAKKVVDAKGRNDGQKQLDSGGLAREAQDPS